MSKARVAILQITTGQMTVTHATIEYGYSRRHLHRFLARVATPDPLSQRISEHTIDPTRNYWRNT